jgi:beta-phosphoglucomutase
MAKIKACLFDLDGVICDSGKFHFLSWKRMASELGFELSQDFSDTLKGLNRTDSLRKILDFGKILISDDEKIVWANKKNEWYLEFVNEMTPSDIFPGVVKILEEAKSKEFKIALVSNSKNANLVLENLNLTAYFEHIIDGNMVENGKPDPEIYRKAIEIFDLKPKECLVFEDSYEGVKASLAAGCKTVGIGDMKMLKKADLVISDFEDITFQEILECISHH